MDYGHTNPQGFGPQEIEGQAFFTAGVGNVPASENAANGTENLNTNQDPWAYTPERDNVAIGNKIISIPGEYGMAGPQPQVEYGNIVPIGQEMQGVQGAQPQVEQATIYDISAIRTAGDHLDKNAITEIKKIESKLDQDHDLNNFYDDIRRLTSVNLKNSYNRDLGGGSVAQVDPVAMKYGGKAA